MSKYNLENFDLVPDHTNNQEQYFCCPHCLSSQRHPLYGINKPKVINCVECSKPFVIWHEEMICSKSAKLPDNG